MRNPEPFTKVPDSVPDLQVESSSHALPSLFTRDFVLLCFVTLSYFSSFFFFFPTLPFYIKHLGGHETDVGLLIGVSSLIACLVKPLAGRWIDRHGRVGLMSAAAGVFACMAVLHAWALNLPFLFGLRVVYGIAIGCFTTAAGAYLADVAPIARRGEAASYWGLVSPLAMGIIPPLALGLMSSTTLHPLEKRLVVSLPGLTGTFSWPENFALLFFTAAGGASCACLLSRGMHERHTPSPIVQRRPWFAREALFPMTVNSLLYVTFTSYTTFLPLYARTFGMQNAGYLYSIYALALLSTRFLSARVSDQRGRAAVIIPGLGSAILALLVLALAPNSWFLYIGVILYGLGFGLAQPGLSALMIDRLSPERRGIGMSTFGQGIDLGMGIGGVLMGYIATHSGLSTMYLWGGGCITSALIIFLWGNRSAHHQSGPSKA
jgi:MFS family permease